MPILPIDTGRYGTPEMLKVYNEESRLQKLLNVEAALALAHAEVGNISKGDAEKIVSMSSIQYVTVERVKAIEKEIKHDIASLVRALSEQCGSSGAFVHLGSTSYDIVDTANALQLKDAMNLLEQKLVSFKKILQIQAGKHAATVMIGRTHGQHALPITLGFKFAVWGYEINRHIERIHDCRKRVLTGKISGAVGTQAGLGKYAEQIQDLVMKHLDLTAAEISTQIVQRDRYAELVCIYAEIASSLENFATEIRELQRPEIAEVFEAFEAKKQVGSSTMPHKQNPEICERICGLARIIRSLTLPALENMVTWHERDLTQSSTERFLLPESNILLDYILTLMLNVVENLRIDEQRMLTNLTLTQGRAMSESVMMALVHKGVNRQEAHEILRKLTIQSTITKQDFQETLQTDPLLNSKLCKQEIEDALNPRNYLGTAIKQAEKFAHST
ncbi:MAG: adenylosuccinate lyase [Nitrososphaerota archaeon]|nr:adenylosuccinate lyase [Nitrososphaerota archaeon]